MHVGVTANRCVYKEVATGTALDVIDGCVLVKGECVGVVHVIHQGEQGAGLEGTVRLVAERADEGVVRVTFEVGHGIITGHWCRDVDRCA